MNFAPETRPRGGLRGLLDKLDAAHGASGSAVLGVVVATEGSTYQKPGALVLLGGDGVKHGVISGGCLEPELERRAQAVLDSGYAALVDFDTRSDDDLVFGSGVGCRGRVHLLLLPQPPAAPLTQALHCCAADGVTLALELALEESTVGCGNAQIVDTSTMAQHDWCWDARGMASADRAAERHSKLLIPPPPRVLLLGAGPETPALLDFMHHFGWFVTLVEHRGRWLTFARDGHLDRLLELPPSALPATLAPRPGDATIVMSHNYTTDAQYLRFCAQHGMAYVGLLGPPARRDALLAELGAAADALQGCLHAPVGLDLGGTGAEAIALAIVAELQQFFAQHRRG